MNMLPIRIRIAADRSLRALVAHVRGKVLDAYTHQDAPFDAIARALGLTHDLGRNPLFDAMFALQVAVGKKQPTAVQKRSGDVAPIIQGKSTPDGKIDSGDAYVILTKVVG